MFCTTSWERMVKSVKRLKKTLGRSLLTFEEITTIVCEIEAVLNDRPITYCYDDEGGISYPLTPSEIINGRCFTKLNDRVFEHIKKNEALTKKVRYLRNLLVVLQIDGRLNICKVCKKFQLNREVKARTLRSEK